MNEEKIRKAISLLQECLNGEDDQEEMGSEDMEMEDSEDSSEVSDKIKMASALMKRRG